MPKSPTYVGIGLLHLGAGALRLQVGNAYLLCTVVMIRSWLRYDWARIRHSRASISIGLATQLPTANRYMHIRASLGCFRLLCSYPSSHGLLQLWDYPQISLKGFRTDLISAHLLLSKAYESDWKSVGKPWRKIRPEISFLYYRCTKSTSFENKRWLVSSKQIRSDIIQLKNTNSDRQGCASSGA